ncbi:MAG: trigger factor [Lachnospiraceae bacterium]|nr:trigger factor [Lachnospiraceae bacterium]MBS4936455.1 trigger factor [Lachnospiraceae bacterium]
MSLKVENLEKNMAKLTITVAADDFTKAIKASYEKNKNKFAVPGFRKGHATQAMVEKHFGLGALLDDAINVAIDNSYPAAMQESKLEIVSRPEITITKVAKGEDFEYEALVAVYPEVKLNNYKGIEVEKANAEVTDEDIENALKGEQDRNSRMVTVEGRAIEEGDHTVIDFDGSIDGVHFEGGKGEDYPLVIGSHAFIEGFEEQIKGHNIGESFDVHVTFPENYAAKDLAGKAAVFAVTIKDAKKKELPELNDEFASEVSEFDTLDAFKEDLKKKLAVAKEENAKIANENTVVDKVSAQAEVDIPDPMLDSTIDQMVNDYARRMQSQGIPLDQFMEFTGTTMEQIREQMKPQAFQRVRNRVVLEAVVKAENIAATEEEINAELQKMADQYKMDIEKIKEIFNAQGLDQLKQDLAVQKAVNFLVENAKFV